MPDRHETLSAALAGIANGKNASARRALREGEMFEIAKQATPLLGLLRDDVAIHAVRIAGALRHDPDADLEAETARILPHWRQHLSATHLWALLFGLRAPDAITLDRLKSRVGKIDWREYADHLIEWSDRDEEQGPPMPDWVMLTSEKIGDAEKKERARKD